jgi:hypothetical protein
MHQPSAGSRAAAAVGGFAASSTLRGMSVNFSLEPGQCAASGWLGARASRHCDTRIPMEDMPEPTVKDGEAHTMVSYHES